MKIVKNLSCIVAALAVSATANAQLGRGGPEWTTGNSDVQRDSWIKSDSYISAESMAKPGFSYLWKRKLDSKAAASLSQAVMLQTFIGYRGFKQLAFIAGSGDMIYSIDFDLGTPYWERHIPLTGSAKVCSLASVSSPGRNSPLVSPPPGRGLGGAVRPRFHSSNGVPGEGAPADAAGPGFAAPAAPRPATAPGAPAAAPAGGPPAAAPGSPFGRALPVYLITSDGVLHSLGQSTGKDVEKPLPFLPDGSRASDVALVDGAIYAASLPGCAGANQVFAMNAESKEVTSWKAEEDIVGAPTFSSTGNLYIASGKTLTMLAPKSLSAKRLATVTAPFVSMPTIFKVKDKEVAAAGTADGKIVLFDSVTGESLGSFSTAAKPTSLSSWEDAGGTRWILVTDSSASKGSVQALKLSMDGAKATLSEAWKSTELNSPATPAIINGVVFALGKGKVGTPAILYAFDGLSGAHLWDSGKTVTSHVTTGGLSASNGQIYFGTADNTLYAFGFPQERQ